MASSFIYNFISALFLFGCFKGLLYVAKHSKCSEPRSEVLTAERWLPLARIMEIERWVAEIEPGSVEWVVIERQREEEEEIKSLIRGVKAKKSGMFHRIRRDFTVSETLLESSRDSFPGYFAFLHVMLEITGIKMIAVLEVWTHFEIVFLQVV
ncbi:hypothetical protein K501DRAFT_278616 [Backusella circina FSU 941]|nr:hypothetical protein K501DRAFT_278616 [Backusella circina FSU 941]